MMGKCYKILTAGLLSGLYASAALPATLKSEVTIYSNVVMAKDLFDDAGENGDELLFLAPDIGETGKISARRVASEAYNVGIYDVSINGIETVSVHRPSERITRDKITDELKQQLQIILGDTVDFEIVTSTLPPLVHADPRVDHPFRLEGLRPLDNSQRFVASALIQTFDGPLTLAIRGIIMEMVNVATLTFDIQRDAILVPGDIIEKRIPRERLRPGSITAIDGLIGKAATRNLSTASILREQDVSEPLLIKANDPVSITYAIPGLILTAQGRALDAGAKNSIISVRNLQSNRTIRGRVSDKGEVIVDVRSPLIANTLPSSAQEIQ